MISKISRTILGLPFVILIWVIIAPVFAGPYFVKWLVCGKIQCHEWNDTFDIKMYHCTLLLPCTFIKNIWGKK